MTPEPDFSAIFAGGFPLIEGRYDTQDIRILPSQNREVEVVGTGQPSYYDTKAFLEAVLIAVEQADDGVIAEVMAERAKSAATDAPVTTGADVRLR